MNQSERGRNICMAFSTSGVSFSRSFPKLGLSLKSSMFHSALHRLECLRFVMQFVLHIDPHELLSQQAPAPSNPCSSRVFRLERYIRRSDHLQAMQGASVLIGFQSPGT